MKRPCLLEQGHDISAFDCGEETLNNFLKENAWQSQLKNITTTYVCLEENKAIAYYSLNVGAIMHEQALDRVVKEFGAYNTPVLLIDKLAVDKRKQKQAIDKYILQDALLRACTIAQEAGIRCIVVNAINERAKKFYQQFNFEPWPIDSFRLYLLMKDVRKTLTKEKN